MTEQERMQMLSNFEKSMPNLPGHEEYAFLTSKIQINDYQFGKIFQGGRRVGKTWAKHMRYLLECKDNKVITVRQRDFHTEPTVAATRSAYRDLQYFIQEHFSDYFDILHLNHTEFRLTYKPKEFKKTHPEFFV